METENRKQVAQPEPKPVLADGLYDVLTHIQNAVRFHQALQAKNGRKKTLLLHTFILMNNIGLWSKGFSLMDVYPKIDSLIELNIITRRRNNPTDLYESYFLTDERWLEPFR